MGNVVGAGVKVVDAGTDGADHAGEVTPQKVGETLNLAVLSAANLPVGAVYAGRVNVDENTWRWPQSDRTAVGRLVAIR